MHRRLLLQILLAAAGLCQPAWGGEGSDAGLEIHHDGVMQFDIRRMGAHAIGTSEVFHPDFRLSVWGQLRLMAAPKLFRRSEEGAASRFSASPRLVSLVAIGDITLTRNGHDEPMVPPGRLISWPNDDGYSMVFPSPTRPPIRAALRHRQRSSS